MDLEKFIREVTRKPGVSGYEAESGSYIAEQFRPLVDSVEVDVMQNVIARVGTEGPRLHPERLPLLPLPRRPVAGEGL